MQHLYMVYLVDGYTCKEMYFLSFEHNVIELDGK